MKRKLEEDRIWDIEREVERELLKKVSMSIEYYVIGAKKK